MEVAAELLLSGVRYLKQNPRNLYQLESFNLRIRNTFSLWDVAEIAPWMMQWPPPSWYQNDT